MVTFSTYASMSLKYFSMYQNICAFRIKDLSKDKTEIKSLSDTVHGTERTPARLDCFRNGCGRHRKDKFIGLQVSFILSKHTLFSKPGFAKVLRGPCIFCHVNEELLWRSSKNWT